MILTDSVEISKPRMTREGYLAAEARVARTGIQNYLAGELGLDGDPNRVIRVYRPPEEVFAVDSMASYAHRPITIEHPSKLVDSKNWKEHATGQTGDEVMRDGEFVRVPILLMDNDAIEAWKRGVKELSMGYTMDLDVVDGVTPEGESYDAVQRNLRMNHLALVAQARGGSQLKLGDNKPEDSNMELQKVTVDGLSVDTTPQGAEAIRKLQKELDEKEKKLDEMKKEHDEEKKEHDEDLEKKDKELAAKDAEIDALKSKILDADALDAAVRERADLISKAKLIADSDYTGLSPADIRKKAVSAALGDRAAIDEKSEAYIEARFDTLVEDANADPVRRTLRDGNPRPTNDRKMVEDAHSEYRRSLEQGYLSTSMKEG